MKSGSTASSASARRWTARSPNGGSSKGLLAPQAITETPRETQAVEGGGTDAVGAGRRHEAVGGEIPEGLGGLPSRAARGKGRTAAGGEQRRHVEAGGIGGPAEVGPVPRHDAHHPRTAAVEVVGGGAADRAEALDEHPLAGQPRAGEVVVGGGGGGDAEAGDQVGDPQLGREDAGEVDRQAAPGPQPFEARFDPGAGGAEVAGHHPLLRMRQAEALLDQRDDLADLVDVEVAAGAVAVAQVGTDRLEPARQHRRACAGRPDRSGAPTWRRRSAVRRPGT